MSQSNSPRYRPLAVPSTRRNFLSRSAFGGLALIVVNACGGKSETSTTETSTPEAAAAPATEATTAVAPTPTVEPSAVPVEGTDAAAQTTEVVAAPAGDAFGATAEMVASFTYVASGGGRVNNPYLAVWIEDENEMPVRTLLVSILQGNKGRKWLRDLRRWYSGDQVRLGNGGADLLDTMSSPTRSPGTTEVVWDGADDTGALVAGGSYYLCIEAAREHGPYDLIRELLSFTGEPFDQQLADSGDLQQVMVSVRPRS